MKTTCLFVLLAAALARNASADILAQWNFNSLTPDATTTTGSTTPSTGSGTIAMVGGATQTFSSAAASGASGQSTDPATSDNTAYHTLTYPGVTAGNKTRGLQVNVSTLGYESIVVTWDQRQSSTASKYFRFQYAVDGVNFVEGPVFSIDTPDRWFNGRTVDLSSILGVNQNANFAFRIVSEFESTATGLGTAGYVGTSSGYSGNGTVRFDMITVSGTVFDPNTFPTITAISNQTILVDTATEPLPFTVGDVETPAEELLVSGASSNPTLVDSLGIVFDGSGSNRTVLVGPNFDQTGTATITITVRDGGGKVANTSFLLTVLPNNTPPVISGLTNLHTVKNTAFEPFVFTVSDLEQPADTLSVTATSSDPAIIPNESIVVIESGSQRTLSMTPAADAVGNAVITVTVDDGLLSTNRVFNAMVVPSSGVIFSEPFNYTDGALVRNSGQLWVTRAGTPNQMQLLGGEVQVTASQSEDVMATLIGAPYTLNASNVLYASFNVTFTGLPSSAPDFFAHFAGSSDSGDLRGRVLASTTNAAPGTFRLGIANSTSTASNVVYCPVDLALDTPVNVVMAYNVATGGSKLWVDPASGGTAVSAIDPRAPIPMNFFALRQNSGIGRLRMDNLLVGLSYEAVTPYLTRVRIRRTENTIEVYWPSGGQWEGFFLESTPTLENADWQPVNQTTVSIDGWDIVTIENPDPNENRFFRLKKSF